MTTRRGLSLVELLVAIAVVALGAWAIVTIANATPTQQHGVPNPALTQAFEQSRVGIEPAPGYYDRRATRLAREAEHPKSPVKVQFVQPRSVTSSVTGPKGRTMAVRTAELDTK